MRTNPRLARLGSHPIAAVQDRARAMRSAGVDLVDFSIGDPREPTPPFVVRALQEAVPEISRYPTTRGLPGLRQAIAGYVDRRFGVEVDPETQVLPTSGSKEAIFSTALAFVDPEAGEAVIWPTPGYPVYERGAVLAGAVGMPIRLSDGVDFTPGLVPDEAWERARLIWTCSPHNPTGSVMPIGVIRDLLDACRRHDVLVCADECYVDLYDGDPPPSVLEAAGPGSDGVLSYLSLSKRSGMTGYRSGAVVGDADAIAALVSLRTSTGTAAPEFTQAAAIAAWDDDDHVAWRRDVFAIKREILVRAFMKAGMTVWGSEAGLYVWVEVDDDLAVARRLLSAGVVVSPGRAFGPGGEGHIRLALVPPVEECEAAAEAVVACLTGT